MESVLRQVFSYRPLSSKVTGLDFGHGVREGVLSSLLYSRDSAFGKSGFAADI